MTKTTSQVFLLKPNLINSLSTAVNEYQARKRFDQLVSRPTGFYVEAKVIKEIYLAVLGGKAKRVPDYLCHLRSDKKGTVLYMVTVDIPVLIMEDEEDEQ